MDEEIVGREGELAAIRSVLGREDANGVLLIEGEPGVGKTTLWRWAVEEAERGGSRVVVASPSEPEAQLAFTAAGDLLASASEDVLEKLPPPQRRALAVALLLEDTEEGAAEPRAIPVAFLGALRELAGERPLVVAVDDVQWLDASSALLLEFALRRLSTERITFVLARRASGRLPLGLDRTSLGVERLELGPLSLGALHRLLRNRLGSTLPRPLLRRLHAASGGNPFYALELARALAERGTDADAGQPLALPETVGELLRDRLSALPDSVQDALAAAAALSSPTVFAVDADAALDRAVEEGIVEINGEAVRFTHPLLASEAYAMLGAERRRRLHRRLATVVVDPEERARHVALAATERSEHAASEVDRAAARALRRGAPDAAVELATLALRLTPADPDSARLIRRLALVDYRIAEGDWSGAQRDLDELAGDLGPGPERAEVLARGIKLAPEAGVAIELGERTLAEPGIRDETRAAVHRTLAEWQLVLGDVRRARAEAEATISAAEASGSAEWLAQGLAVAGLYATLMGDPPSTSYWQRARDLERSLADRALFYGPRLAHGIALMCADRIDEARAALEEDYAHATRLGDDFALTASQMHLVELECRAGRPPVAARYADELYLLVGQTGNEQMHAPTLYARALADAYLGRVDEARAAAEEGIAAAEAVPDVVFRIQNQAVLGFLELSLGKYDAAANVLASRWDELAAMGYGEPSIYPVLPNAIEALVATGRVDDARRQLAELDERGRALDSIWALAQAARCRGLLAAAEGDLDDAALRFSDALELHERLPSPFERARTLLAFGATLRRANARRRARETLTEALGEFERIGTPLWAGRARGELSRIGGRAPSAGRLTPVEERVAALVAEGHTNREVAAALYLSERTVEGHLSRVYAKVGVRSRAELAHRMSAPPVS